MHINLQEVRHYPFVPFLPGKRRQTSISRVLRFLPVTDLRSMYTELCMMNHFGKIQMNSVRKDLKDGTFTGLTLFLGGDYWTNHRCAGEWITVIIMEKQ